MKEYEITISETLKKSVTVKADSIEEAKQLVSDKWNNSEYILDADDFTEVIFECEEPPAAVNMSYSEMCNRFRQIERANANTHLSGFIVFTVDSFDKPYDEHSRTYGVSSNNKAFQPGMGGYSIYASCLDGSDFGVRLESYMTNERGDDNGWKIERCYMMQDELDRVKPLLEKAKEHER